MSDKIKKILKQLNEDYPGQGMSTAKKVALGTGGLALIGTEGGRNALSQVGKGIGHVGNQIGTTVGKAADTASHMWLNNRLQNSNNGSYQTSIGKINGNVSGTNTHDANYKVPPESAGKPPTAIPVKAPDNTNSNIMPTLPKAGDTIPAVDHDAHGSTMGAVGSGLKGIFT